MVGNSIKTGIIGGTNILEISVLEDVKEVNIDTPYGVAEVDIGKISGVSVGLIRRHGRNHDKPPHVINHQANLYALKQLGARYILALSSVGCLREDIDIPAFIVPDDYIDFGCFATIYKNNLIHITPGFDPDLRHVLIKAAKSVIKEYDLNITLLEHGVYFQFRGPRLETKAEINIIKKWADCTGMTAASEATVAKELKLKYAVLCTMDNYGHGIKGQGIDYLTIKKRAKENAGIALKIIGRAVEVIADEYID